VKDETWGSMVSDYVHIWCKYTHNVLDWGKRGEGEDRRGGKGIEGRKGGEKGDVLTTSTY